MLLRSGSCQLCTQDEPHSHPLPSPSPSCPCVPSNVNFARSLLDIMSCTDQTCWTQRCFYLHLCSRIQVAFDAAANSLSLWLCLFANCLGRRLWIFKFFNGWMLQSQPLRFNFQWISSCWIWTWGHNYSSVRISSTSVAENACQQNAASQCSLKLHTCTVGTSTRNGKNFAPCNVADGCKGFHSLVLKGEIPVPRVDKRPLQRLTMTHWSQWHTGHSDVTHYFCQQSDCPPDSVTYGLASLKKSGGN